MKPLLAKKGERFVFGLTLVILCTGVFLAYISGLMWNEPRLGLIELMNGTAYRPYVYRVLLPFLVKVAVTVYPLRAEFYASTLIYLSLIGFALSIRELSATFWNPPLIPNLIALASVLAPFPLMLTNRHVYDFTTLFLFTFSLAWMVKCRWSLYLLAFALTCLNKETAIFLTVIFVVCFYEKTSQLSFRKLAALQLGVYVAIRLPIIYIFRNNPGAAIEFHLLDHISMIANWPVGPLMVLALGGMVAWLVQWRWTEKPFFLRRAALAVVPIFVVLYFLFGNPMEIRVFYEVFPLLFLLSAPSLGSWIGVDFFAAQRAERDFAWQNR